jgi:cobalamin biosynthesis protein CobT
VYLYQGDQIQGDQIQDNQNQDNQNQDNQNQGDQIQDNQIQDNQIQDNQIQDNQIQDNQNQDNQIQDNQIQDNQNQDNQIQDEGVKQMMEYVVMLDPPGDRAKMTDPMTRMRMGAKRIKIHESACAGMGMNLIRLRFRLRDANQSFLMDGVVK